MVPLIYCPCVSAVTFPFPENLSSFPAPPSSRATSPTQLRPLCGTRFLPPRACGLSLQHWPVHPHPQHICVCPFPRSRSEQGPGLMACSPRHGTQRINEWDSWPPSEGGVWVLLAPSAPTFLSQGSNGPGGTFVTSSWKLDATASERKRVLSSVGCTEQTGITSAGQACRVSASRYSLCKVSDTEPASGAVGIREENITPSCICVFITSRLGFCY